VLEFQDWQSWWSFLFYPPSLVMLMVRLACFLTILFSLAACLPVSLPTETLQPSPIPGETPTLTPTVIWFPPTRTPIPFPTQTIAPPTPEQRPNLGEIIFTDDFSSAEFWDLAFGQTASAALGKNELTLAIQEGRTYIATTRSQPILGDFYAEITASPTLCHSMDEYGLLVRYASAGDFYRFAISCDGQVKLDRVLNGQASTPHPWELGLMVPVGAPSSSRLGIWVAGKEIRCFVNDRYQFTVTDPSISSGLIGMFARSTGEGALTVSYSDLVVREVLP
jgi:hypothetical protein